MVSAVMSVRPMAVSRPSMALRTQVGMPYLSRLRLVNTCCYPVEHASDYQGVAAAFAMVVATLALSCTPHKVQSVSIVSQATSIRGSALISRPATRSVRCNRMIVRAAVSQTALRTQTLLQFACIQSLLELWEPDCADKHTGYRQGIGGREENHC